MAMLIPEPATQQELANLATYKYSGKDYSLSSKYFMGKWWELVVSCVPLTVAPNMLTFIGFLCTTSTTLLLAYFFLYENGVLPNWIFLWMAVSLFSYQTLDAIDGKQARRTGCGSPLGELFDHGCDSLFTPFSVVWICLAMGYTPLESFICCFAVNTTLFTSLFEQFSTGTLDLGYINGPVDGILVSVACFAWTFLVGPQWWATPFTNGPLLDFAKLTAGYIPWAIRKPNDLNLLLGVGGAVCTSIGNVLHACTQPKAHEGVSRGMVFIPVLTVALLVIAAVYRVPHILTGPFPFAIELAYGLFISYTVTRMTIARLCKGKYNPFSGPFRIIMSSLMTVLSMQFFVPSERITTNPLINTAPMAIAAVLALGSYVRLALGIIIQFAHHLKINVLTMTKEQRERNIQKQKGQ